MSYQQLDAAVSVGNLDACRALIAEGVDVTSGHSAWTVLHIASAAGYVEICRLLIEAGADVNGGTTEWAPIIAASHSGHCSVVDLLLNAGADPLAKTCVGETALTMAACKRHLDVCRVFVRCGVHIDAPDGDGRTALMHAARLGDVELCKSFLDLGANVNAVDREGWAPVMLAGLQGRAEAFKLLCKSGADVTSTVKSKSDGALNAFQVAVKFGAKAVVDYCIAEIGEDPAQQTESGKTMVQLADSSDVMKLLHSARTTTHIDRMIDSASADDAHSSRRVARGAAPSL